MHVPERTGAAKLRERESAGRKALRDVAGVVDAEQEERNTARVRPLQRREPMTDLLEAGIEALCQQMDVVVERFGSGEECRVWHHHGSGKIIGEGDAEQAAGGVVERA